MRKKGCIKQRDRSHKGTDVEEIIKLSVLQAQWQGSFGSKLRVSWTLSQSNFIWGSHLEIAHRRGIGSDLLQNGRHRRLDYGKSSWNTNLGPRQYVMCTWTEAGTWITWHLWADWKKRSLTFKPVVKKQLQYICPKCLQNTTLLTGSKKVVWNIASIPRKPPNIEACFCKLQDHFIWNCTYRVQLNFSSKKLIYHLQKRKWCSVRFLVQSFFKHALLSHYLQHLGSLKSSQTPN